MIYANIVERVKELNNDAWLSLVERCVRDAEVAGSNPVASTSYKKPETLRKSKFPVFFILKNNFTYSGILSGLERFYANASEPFVLCGLSPGALIENCI